MSVYDQTPYASSSTAYGGAYGNEPLQFYSGPSDSRYYARESIEGERGGVSGSMASSSGYGNNIVGGSIIATGGFWSAFGTGGVEGEPPLLEGTVCPFP